MPEITPKPPEVIQAQLAAFATEGIKDYEDKRYIYNNIGDLAVAGQEATEKTISTATQYTDYLRSVGGSRHETIRGRSDILKAYSAFAPEVEALKRELVDPATRREHPAYLGHGSNTTVLSITKDGKSYAVRIPEGKATSPNVIDGHIAGAVLGKGIPHLEQIVAASYVDGVTVAEIMPGKEMGKLTLDDINQISDAQLDGLIDTLMAANERGIHIDPKPSNFFYDRETGFGIVDYHSSKEMDKASDHQKLGVVVSMMSIVINGAGIHGRPYTPNILTAEDFANDNELGKASLAVLKRYAAIVKTRLHGAARQTAMSELDLDIQKSQKLIEEASDPAWVARQVEGDRKRKQFIADRKQHPRSPTNDPTKLNLDIID